MREFPNWHELEQRVSATHWDGSPKRWHFWALLRDYNVARSA
jgi:hypothetical protein